ncbi:MAG: hydroxyquinol 1,2-dioxygenase [Betaproteobacteria bacterium]|nr:hydroxyquinol 1,2-dioxygenase [Betaproteobacteria bacterium]NBT09661.1 hydroxyquinol 1,2-dioxygenase [Betaproteobacteria bacterium]NBU49319.1 hydroxyquinol 1,2-dioxygenase [Betaproteobacteria bacterium]NBX96164.1 hydroxyquinol 1,2-dioxygenase [Betaproteobacteria bacterium]
MNTTTSTAYDTTEQITQEVLRRYEQTPDPRLREIMLSLVRHLHAFAKDVRLTSEEWLFAMKALEETGRWCAPGRNEFIIFSDALGLSMLTVTQDYRRPAGATEPTLLGPFLLEGAPRFEMGADISAGAQGTPLHAQGRVLDLQGQPVAHAVIDVWHSDDRGLYDVQDGFEENGAWARGQLTTGADGRWRFWSVMPVDYPIPQDGTAIEMLRATTGRSMRPAHLHFRIVAQGQRPLVTHIFDRQSQVLHDDAVFGVRPSLVADFVRHPAGTAPDGRVMGAAFCTLDYDFVMAPA